MPALLELTSEANGYVTPPPSNVSEHPPARLSATPRVPVMEHAGLSWSVGQGVLHHQGACADTLFKKAREVGNLLLKLRVAEVVGSKLPAFPGL